MRLQELILARMAERGLSYDQLVARANTAGHPLSRSGFHFLATHQLTNVPATSTILAVAAALDVDPDEVLTAAGESVGIITREVKLGRGTRAWLSLIEDRSDDEVEQLQRVAHAVVELLDHRQGTSDEFDVSHTEPAEWRAPLPDESIGPSGEAGGVTRHDRTG